MTDIPDPPTGSAIRVRRTSNAVRLTWKVPGRVQRLGLLTGPFFAGGFCAALLAGLGLLSGAVDWDLCMKSMVVFWPAFTLLWLVVYLVRVTGPEIIDLTPSRLSHREALQQERVPVFRVGNPLEMVSPSQAAGISNFLRRRHTRRIEREGIAGVSSRTRDDCGQVVVAFGSRRHIIRRGLSPGDADYLASVLRRCLEEPPADNDA